MRSAQDSWWKNAVIYQVYPRSFQDSNGDGIGDIPGIIEHLDYLQNLGIQGIWLSPIYKSPNDDNGYDISDYEAIMPEFGTMEDMERLLAQANRRGIRIVMDLVANHTSDEHRWFKQSRKSRDNQYRDYYIWRDPVEGHEPNDLQSTFGGSAWSLDEVTGQYYLHLFSPKQPDLNWENPKVRDEVFKLMNFWIDKGIGGFRMDVIDLIGKVPDEGITSNGPKLHEYLQEMNRSTFGDSDFLTVGETWGATPEKAKLYSDPKRHELSMVFQFEHIGLDQEPGGEKWDLQEMRVPDLKTVLSKWQTELGEEGWNSLFWNNHDLPRIVSRWGNDEEFRVRSAELFAILLHTMRGTPYIYQGEEIGMTNNPVTDISQIYDIESRNYYFEKIQEGVAKDEVLRSINTKGRDNARTPMQWNSHENAGFSYGQPWMPVNPNYAEINVEKDMSSKHSIFRTYQKLIALRKDHRIVVDGDYSLVKDTKDDVFAFERSLGSEKWLTVANISKEPHEFVYAAPLTDLIISNYDDVVPERTGNESKITLRPYEAFTCSVNRK